MLTIIEIFLITFSIFSFLVCGLLLLQVLVASMPTQLNNPLTEEKEANAIEACILMPAHNEASGLEKILIALEPQLNERTNLLIVADNCTDNTFDIARKIAYSNRFIKVIERKNINLRGKGYALDYGIKYLAVNKPDVLIVLDSDCEVSDGAIETLIQKCATTNRPIQALYRMRTVSGAPTRSRIAEFAWIVKNFVRPLGYYRLGLPCQLMGTGMAFQWEQISQVKLHTGSIVEDMQMGIELASKNSPPLFCPDAVVTSYFPSTTDGLLTQRTRWEHGHLGVILAEVPRLLKQSLACRQVPLFAMAIDLCVPPLALLALYLLVVCATNSIFWWTSGAGLQTLRLSLAAMMLFGISMLLAWLRFGREAISFTELCGAPKYVISKIPLYLKFVIRRQISWVRSKRDGEL